MSKSSRSPPISSTFAPGFALVSSSSESLPPKAPNAGFRFGGVGLEAPGFFVVLSPKARGGMVGEDVVTLKELTSRWNARLSRTYISGWRALVWAKSTPRFQDPGTCIQSTTPPRLIRHE